jgi:superfamily I DNA and/or RNA helicase
VAEGDFNVIAGTTWLFASQVMRDNPVDVLVVDEAGQLGLADTLAAAISATNVILLGDPQQLAQVSKASHPGGAGASALEHLLGDALTVPPDRGVLLETTWRMHPDVCEFISEVMYGGKLHSHATCGGQSAAGRPVCGGCEPSTRAAPPSRPRRQRSSWRRWRSCSASRGPISTASPVR